MESISPRLNWRLLWAGIILLAVAMYVAHIGAYPLLDPDEGRYAEIPREMLERGNFITPTLNYVKYFEKPPLFYWITAGSLATFGENEFAVRLVPAIIGLLMVMLVMGLGARMLGRPAGLLAGWIYLTSLMTLIMARLPIIDGLFSACLAASWGSWWLGYAAPPGASKTRWYMASWVCLGLAVMAKGPVALLLSILVIGIFLAWRRDWSALRTMALIPGLAAFAIVTVPWFVAVSLHNPEFAHFFFIVEHVQRFLGETKEHVKPFYFFFPLIPAGLFAWGPMLIVAAYAALAQYLRSRRYPQAAATLPEVQAPGNGGLGYLLIWAGVVVLFFSASSCKLVPYILPAFPAVALLLAWYLHNGGSRKPSIRWAAAITAILLLLAAAAGSKLVHDKAVAPAQIAPIILALRISLGLAGLLLLVGAWRQRLLVLCAGLALVVIVPTLIAGAPVVSGYRRSGVFLKAMPQPLPASVTVAQYRTYDQSISFYTHKRTVQVSALGELDFGASVGDQSAYFTNNMQDLRQISARGPLLVNLYPRNWPELRALGLFRIVAGHTARMLVANDAFFNTMKLQPWPESANIPTAHLLLPQPVGSVPAPAR